MDCGQELVLSPHRWGKRGLNWRRHRGVELVDDAHVEATGSEQVLEVGTILGRGLGLGNDILIGTIVVREVRDEIVTEQFQVIGETHVAPNGNANREHIGEESGGLLKLIHRTPSNSHTDDEGVLSGVLVGEHVVGGEESGKGRGGGGGDIVIVPIGILYECLVRTVLIDLSFDLGDRALFNLGRLGEGQDEGLDALQLLAPVLDLPIAKFGATIGSSDQPVTEIGAVERAFGWLDKTLEDTRVGDRRE